jgi:serine/threonine-protein kinase RsbW
MDKPEIIQLEIPSTAQFVAVARKAAECIGARMEMTDEQLYDTKLAVGEACSNAIKFSAPDSPAVQLVYRISPDSLEVEVRNKGEAFGPVVKLSDPVDVGIAREGGLGLYLICQVMDELDISCESGETTVRMVKHLHDREGVCCS